MYCNHCIFPFTFYFLPVRVANRYSFAIRGAFSPLAFTIFPPVYRTVTFGNSSFAGASFLMSAFSMCDRVLSKAVRVQFHVVSTQMRSTYTKKGAKFLLHSFTEYSRKNLPHISLYQ